MDDLRLRNILNVYAELKRNNIQFAETEPCFVEGDDILARLWTTRNESGEGGGGALVNMSDEDFEELAKTVSGIEKSGDEKEAPKSITTVVRGGEGKQKGAGKAKDKGQSGEVELIDLDAPQKEKTTGKGEGKDKGKEKGEEKSDSKEKGEGQGESGEKSEGEPKEKGDGEKSDADKDAEGKSKGKGQGEGEEGGEKSEGQGEGDGQGEGQGKGEGQGESGESENEGEGEEDKDQHHGSEQEEEERAGTTETSSQPIPSEEEEEPIEYEATKEEIRNYVFKYPSITELFYGVAICATTNWRDSKRIHRSLMIGTGISIYDSLIQQRSTLGENVLEMKKKISLQYLEAIKLLHHYQNNFNADGTVTNEFIIATETDIDHVKQMILADKLVEKLLPMNIILYPELYNEKSLNAALNFCMSILSDREGFWVFDNFDKEQPESEYIAMVKEPTSNGYQFIYNEYSFVSQRDVKRKIDRKILAIVEKNKVVFADDINSYPFLTTFVLNLINSYLKKSSLELEKDKLDYLKKKKYLLEVTNYNLKGILAFME